eukprot:CAMPEP_0184864198 /NCGR_PEP_ID=MMETSP0580-20130426/14084_1 /TAXON_ID=1118495 /ORGANISM="Dactyliosolen fragilissimus" /LENGTH=522 /DNA_ID=CAMNT_0027362883 /DNA_START=319 /DNA_END=1887 /DNA_ORIENTATION=+
MPNLFKLKKKGLLFTDAHSTPLCAPSRYSLLSGNNPHRGTGPRGSWTIIGDVSQFTEDQVSLPKLLKEKAGYNTGIFGKWHLGARASYNNTWEHPRTLENIITDTNMDWSLPLDQAGEFLGFKKSYISLDGINYPPFSFFKNDYLTSSKNETVYWSKGSYKMPHGISKIVVPGEGDQTWDSSAFDMIVVNKTKNFIKQHLKHQPDRPFFAYAAMTNNHYPFTPPDYHLDGTKVKGRYKNDYLDLIHHFDKNVGSLIKFIDKKNLGKDTIIIVASDNGGELNLPFVHSTNGPLAYGKGSAFEGGHRIPFMMRWDGMLPKNKKRHNMIHLTDIYATISEIVNITAPIGSAHDSLSFYKFAKRANMRDIKRYKMFVLGVSERQGQVYSGLQFSYRKENLKLIYQTGATNTLHVYDLIKDVREKRNLFWEMRNTKSGSEKLVTLFKEMMSESPCPFEDSKKYFQVKGQEEYKSCAFFAKRPDACNQYPEGVSMCPSVCGKRFHKFCTTWKVHGYDFTNNVLKDLGF